MSVSTVRMVFIWVNLFGPAPEGLRDVLLGVIMWNAHDFIEVYLHHQPIYYYTIIPLSISSLFDYEVDHQPHEGLIPGNGSYYFILPLFHNAKYGIEGCSLFVEGTVGLLDHCLC